MNIQTPGTNRFSNYRGGIYRNRRWYCSCNKETKYVKTRVGDNEDRDFYKCAQVNRCGFWLWVEHETEARRRLADALSPEPQTPSKSRQSGIQSSLQSTPSTFSESATRGYSNSIGSDRVLRSARQATPTSSQVNQRFLSPQIPDEDNELATKVMDLLEDFKIQLNSKQKRKLQVLIDDYIEEVEIRPSEDEYRYYVN